MLIISFNFIIFYGLMKCGRVLSKSLIVFTTVTPVAARQGKMYGISNTSAVSPCLYPALRIFLYNMDRPENLAENK